MAKLENVLVALTLAATASSVRADGSAPPKEVKDMSCLIGNWKLKGSVSMGTDKAPVTGTFKCAWLPSQWGVECNGDITGIPGMPHYLERDLMGFEPNSRKYHWYAITNAGETHDHVADVPSGNDIRFVYTGTQDGKPMKEVIDWHFAQDAKSLHLKAETFVDGASVAVFEIDGTK